MPASPDMAYDLARQIAVLYEDAELALLQRLQAALAAGIDSPRWAELKFASIGNLRAAVEEVSCALMNDADGAIGRAVVEAYNRGGQAAVAELGALPEGLRHAAAKALPNASRVDRLAASAVADTRPVYARITRAVTDAYRDVVNRASSSVLLGGLTRRQASQRALDQFAGRGISSFTDKAGRNWEMASYAEMAVRSVTGRAAIDGHTDSLLALGQQLVIVSDAPLECPLCRPWEGEILSINGQSGPHTLRLEDMGTERRLFRAVPTVAVHVAGSLVEARAAGLFHPNCFPGDVLVSAPSGVRAADARRYEGELVVIRTASGNELSVTPNHPVLTPEGWVPAGQLEVGRSVLRYSADAERVNGVRPDDQQVPTRISEVFNALRQASPVLPMHVPGAAEQFHGDGGTAEVEVVLADGLLRDRLDAEPGQLAADGELFLGGMGRGPLLPEGSPTEILGGADHTADGFVGGSRQGLTLCRAHAREAPLHGFAASEGLEAVPAEPGAEGGLTEADGGRSLALSLLAGEVALDRVLEIGSRHFDGHVYNLQTGDGWYVAEGLVVHNCRHNISLYLPGVTSRPQSPPHPQGATYEDTQQQRYLERQVRAWKRREAVAMDDAAAAKARASIREYQRRLRELTAETGLRRKSAREQIGAAR